MVIAPARILPRKTATSAKTRATLEAFERSRRIDVAAAVQNAGSGAIMRLAPVVILFRGNPTEARRSAVRQAHG